MEEYVLRTFDLSKKYKNVLVLDKVNINVKKGDIYGFVGENGSGKTTIIRLIAGLIRASGGNYELFGAKNTTNAIYNARKKMGAIVETPSIYLNLSAVDNLKMQATIFGVKDQDKIIQVLKDVGLGNLINDKKKANNFSLGMRQRLGIAMALIGEPEFLILDEPLNGLDPAGIIEIRELILRLNKEKNITFLISSHILTELELIATSYGLISKGKIVREITASELKNECRHSITLEVDNVEKAFSIATKFALQNDIKVFNDKIKIYGDANLNDLLGAIMQGGVKLLGVNTSQSSIEDYYMKVVGGRGNV